VCKKVQNMSEEKRFCPACGRKMLKKKDLVKDVVLECKQHGIFKISKIRSTRDRECVACGGGMIYYGYGYYCARCEHVQEMLYSDQTVRDLNIFQIYLNMMSKQ